jgi:hypothetical protein
MTRKFKLSDHMLAIQILDALDGDITAAHTLLEVTRSMRAAFPLATVGSTQQGAEGQEAELVFQESDDARIESKGAGVNSNR